MSDLHKTMMDTIKSLVVVAGVILGMNVPAAFSENPVSNPANLPSQSVDTAASTDALADTEKSGASSDTITLDFKDADINTVLRVLSIKSKVNIVAGPEVAGTVSIRLENVPWEKALEVVLRTYNYVYERDGNIIRVTTRDKMAQEPVVTQAFILNYTKASEIRDATKDMLTERGRVQIAERTNMLIITDIPTNLYRIQEVIKKLDKRTAQAYIDSKIVKTDVGVTENLGIKWTPGMTVSGSSRPTTFPFAANTTTGKEVTANMIEQFFPTPVTTAAQNATDPRGFPYPKLTAEATYTYGTLNFTNFSAVLEALKSRSNTKVVSNPRIVVLNNQKAKVQVGKQVPIPVFERNENTGSMEVSGFSYRDTGVVFNVTPHINSAEEILVELEPEVSSQGDNQTFSNAMTAPTFNVTKATTQVLIHSGETIAIGGLMTDNSQMDINTVPILGDLPLVGKLFRSKRQTGTANSKAETLFFITVTMVDSEGQPMGSRLEERKKRKQGGNQDENAALQETGSDASSGASDETPYGDPNSPEALTQETDTETSQQKVA